MATKKKSVTKDKTRNGKGVGSYDNLSMTATGKKASGPSKKTSGKKFK